MRFPGVALYHWSGTSPVVTATPDPAANETLVADAFRRCVAPMVLQTNGRQVLHASAVVLPDGVVALCARSRTGKSTLAYALSRGLDRPLWADDAVAFEPLPDGGVATIPLPFSLKLRPAAAAYFGTGTQAAGEHGESSELLAVFTLARSDSVREPRATRLTASRAFTALLEHAYCFDLENPVFHERMVSQYLELSARVPTFELEFPSRFEALPATVDEIQAALRRGAT
jgi:hypothetical protein